MPNALDFLFLFGAGAVLLVLERLLPLHPGQKSLRPGWKVDILHVFLSGTLIRLGTTLMMLAASVFAVSVVPEHIRDAIRAQPDWLEFLELLILSDLCFYAAHRLCHAVPILWRFHAVHHSSEHLDWLATYRVHPVDQILNSTMIALPAIILGFSPIPLLIYALAYRIHSPLLHSNARLDIGPLGLLLTSPRFHHWHHADQVEAYDRNFAGQLSIIDRLFGTHHAPGERSLPIRYGVGGTIPETYVGQLLQPFGVTPGEADPLPPSGPSNSPL
jgi:sterol desaturase/sphingolipid hydroxylase (fatty acid hydroxylase superfamily)